MASMTAVTWAVVSLVSVKRTFTNLEMAEDNRVAGTSVRLKTSARESSFSGHSPSDTLDNRAMISWGER